MARARTKVRPKAKARLRKGKEITTKVRMVEAKDKEVTKAGIKTATMSITTVGMEDGSESRGNSTCPQPGIEPSKFTCNFDSGGAQNQIHQQGKTVRLITEPNALVFDFTSSHERGGECSPSNQLWSLFIPSCNGFR